VLLGDEGASGKAHHGAGDVGIARTWPDDRLDPLVLTALYPAEELHAGLGLEAKGGAVAYLEAARQGGHGSVGAGDLGAEELLTQIRE